MSVFGRPARLLAGILLLSAAPAQADIVWHWEARFSAAERDKLQTWIRRTADAVAERVAQYPFDVHVFFYRRDDGGEPVPWAETRRSRIQGVDFHVDPDYPLEAFLADWTAPHELSHLLLPFVGRRHAWFAEGFASFMQYQVMHAMGELDAAGLQRTYRARIENAARDYTMDETPFAEAAPALFRRGEYPTMYWGGAVYFLRIDRNLPDRPLVALLADYVECCRTREHDWPGLIEALDRLAGEPLFSRQLRVMKNRPGFPEYADLFEDGG